MTDQERRFIIRFLSEYSTGTYLYYASLDDNELGKKLQEFNKQMANNSAGEVDVG